MSNDTAISYHHLPASCITAHQLKECADLFSDHYGVWAASQIRVKMSPQRLQDQLLFDSSKCSMLQARAQKMLVGHAFVCLFEIPGKVTLNFILTVFL
jgi:hypothetical protein